MNIVNVFWGFFAFVINSVISYIGYIVVSALNNAAFSEYPIFYAIFNFGFWAFLIFAVFIIPISIVTDDKLGMRSLYAGIVDKE